MAQFCGKCGTAINHADKFCGKCGEITKNYVEEKKESKDYYSNKMNLVNLVEKLKEGKNNVFEEFYELTKSYMFFTLSKIVRDRDAVDDLVQDSYIVVYQNINSLRDSSAILKWMGRIAQNNAYNYLRKNYREVLLTEDTGFFEDYIESDNTLLPEEAMQSKEVQRLLKEIIDELPQMQRLSVIAFYYNELSIEEVAETLDIPKGTVKTNLYRARAKIKAAIEELASKKDTKLYSTSLTAFLLFHFKEEATACEISKTIYKSINNAIQQQNISQINKSNNALSDSKDVLIKSAQKSTKFVGAGVKSFLAKKILIFLVSVGMITGTIGAVNHLSRSTPEKTIKKLEYSYNKQDIEGMVKCFDPKIQRIYSGVMKFASGISGYSTQDILDSTVELVNEAEINKISRINFRIINVNYFDEISAEVSVELTLYGDSSKEKSNGIIPMVKYNNRWYIKMY